MALDMYNHLSDNLFMNWTKLIQDLVDHGLTQIQIANHCKTGQSYISGLLTGNRTCPSWRIGESLRELHAEKMSPQPAQKEKSKAA